MKSEGKDIRLVIELFLLVAGSCISVQAFCGAAVMVALIEFERKS